MKYKNKIFLLFSLLFFIFCSVVYADTSFDDYSIENKGYPEVSYLLKENIVSGYANKFNPNKLITYSEASQMVYNAFPLLGKPSESWYGTSFDTFCDFYMIDTSIQPLDTVLYEDAIALILQFCPDIPGVIDVNRLDKNQIIQEGELQNISIDKNMFFNLKRKEKKKEFKKIFERENLGQKIIRKYSEELTREDFSILLYDCIQKEKEYKREICELFFKNNIDLELRTEDENNQVYEPIMYMLMNIPTCVLNEISETGWRIKVVDMVGLYFSDYPTAVGMYSASKKTIYITGKNLVKYNTTLYHEIGHYLYYKGVYHPMFNEIYETEKTDLSKLVTGNALKNGSEFFADAFRGYCSRVLDIELKKNSQTYINIKNIHSYISAYCMDLFYFSNNLDEVWEGPLYYIRDFEKMKDFEYVR